jgi:formamidopyrimidine-DNA glycosylase
VPELPEVETIRRGLERGGVLSRAIVRVAIHRADICETPEGRICTAADLLEGDWIGSLQRRGKQLALVGGRGRVVVVQLGMSGQLRLLAAGEPLPGPHVHAEWLIESGERLIFRDPRRFGGLLALPGAAALAARWSALGPDALEITGVQLAEALGASRRAVKAGLLDQGAVAGVGNIYADEALFRARIRPDRLCTSLSRPEYSRLAGAIRQVMEVAIGAGGSTLRDYATATGGRGAAQEGHRVYGRGGQACTRCRRPLEGSRLAGRATVFCPRCQR